MLDKYDNIISLGEACFVATTLINLKLRQFSSPFDWVMGTGLKYRLDALLTDFNDFINIEDLSKLDVDDPDTAFHSYLNNKTGIVFNHEFHKNRTLEDEYPEVREKYDRRFQRLNELLSSQKSNLLIYMDFTTPKQKLTTDELIEYMVRINHKFKTNTIELLYFRFVDEIEDGSIRRINKYLLLADYNGVNNASLSGIQLKD